MLTLLIFFRFTLYNIKLTEYIPKNLNIFNQSIVIIQLVLILILVQLFLNSVKPFQTLMLITMQTFSTRDLLPPYPHYPENNSTKVLSNFDSF